MDCKYFKLEIFIPETHLKSLQLALQRADAGHFGNYDSCLSYSNVTGVWRSLEGSNPYIGSIGKLSQESEIKVEVACLKQNLEKTLTAVKSVHPYEEPIINIIPMNIFSK